MVKDRFEIEGRTWFRTSYAARLLGTSAQRIRKLMGTGELEWRQPRPNVAVFVVDAQAVLELKRRTRPDLQRSPDPLARARKTIGQAPIAEGKVRASTARLRGQIEVIPPAPDGGAPGRRKR